MLAGEVEVPDDFEVPFSSGLRLKLTDLGVPCTDVFVEIFAFFVEDNDNWEVADLLAAPLAAGVVVFAGSGGVFAAVLMVAGAAIMGATTVAPFEVIICF